MILMVRTLSGLFVSLPAVFVAVCAYTTVGDEYYRPAYLISCAGFLVASFLFGCFISPRPQKAPFRSAWTRLFLGGVMAWAFALAVLGSLNLTPLCVGQDNGDGNNNLGMCMSYTLLAAVFYSPLVLTLLAMNAAVGGAIARVQADR